MSHRTSRNVSQTVVASQWNQANHTLTERGYRVSAIPPGAPCNLPPNTDILLLGSPFAWHTQDKLRPPGWPFDLKWIQLATSGFDSYPSWILEGPPVTTARGVTANAVTEYVLAAIFDATKQLQSLWVHDSTWNKRQLAQVGGSTLGIFGFGAIGQQIARMAHALGMRVLYARRSDTPADIDGVERVASLEELVARSDHLVLAAPATSSTRHAVNDSVLAAAKPGLHLINVARGGLIDQAALLRALESGRVHQVTLDVTDPEPLPPNHPLYHHPAVRISPHTSPLAPNTPQLLLQKFLANLERHEAGLPLLDVADPDRGY